MRNVTVRGVKIVVVLAVSVLLVAGVYGGAHALAGALLGQTAPAGVSYQLYPGHYSAMLHRATHGAITGAGAFRPGVSLGSLRDVSGAHVIG